MRFAPILPFLAFVALSFQSPTVKHTRRQDAVTEPCQEVADYIASDPSNSTHLIPASIAYRCLTSIPFNSTATVSFIHGLKNYFQFQSTLAFAADPPPTAHGREPVDLMKGFDKIAEVAANGEYKNHYEFEVDLRILIQKLQDGHARWNSNCLEGLFTFVHGFPIIALADSPDGIPKIYGDIPTKPEILQNTTHHYNISAIYAIDNIPTAKYLSSYIEVTGSPFHDPDARWNYLFTRRSGGDFITGAFSRSVLYQGDNFTVAFENGTSRTVDWMARVNTDFTNITSGVDLFFAKCLADTAIPYTTDEITITETPTSTPVSTQSASSTPTPTRVTGYPDPFSVALDNSISTYILSPTTGVIVIHTFFETDKAGAHLFQSFLKGTIADFKLRGITHVIIDVTGNGGGSIVLGYEAFKQFFPRVDPFAATNMRAHPAAEVFYSVFAEKIVSEKNETLRDIYAQSAFSYRYQRDVSGKYFKSPEEAYGPVESWNDTFTTLTRWDLVDDGAFGWDLDVTNGDVVRNSSYAQPWDAGSIVILGDGTCASTCTMFAEAMREAGVRTFAYGGRPQKGPMQIIGGVEGSQVYSFELLMVHSVVAVETHPEKANEWEEYLPGLLTFMPYPDYSTQFVNIKNSFRSGKSSGVNIPLEYVYDAADFRVQLTKEFFEDVSMLWGEVIKRVWE